MVDRNPLPVSSSAANPADRSDPTDQSDPADFSNPAASGQRGQLHIYSDMNQLAEAAAAFIADRAARAVTERGRFTLALAGGRTPEPVYRRLAEPDLAGRVDWSKVWVLFGDERCVPPGDPRSNYRMAREALLDRVPIPAGQVLRIRGEAEPVAAAEAYEQAMRRLAGGDRPDLDLVLLGLGEEGHTASLFPGMPAVTEPARWVLGQYVEKTGMWRVTLTPAILNQSRAVAFLVAGADKAETLRRVLEGPLLPVMLPAQAIRPAAGELHWLVDAAAAGRLERRP
jgi:6-phosphogluconolactonase